MPETSARNFFGLERNTKVEQPCAIEFHQYANLGDSMSIPEPSASLARPRLNSVTRPFRHKRLYAAACTGVTIKSSPEGLTASDSLFFEACADLYHVYVSAT